MLTVFKTKPKFLASNEASRPASRDVSSSFSRHMIPLTFIRNLSSVVLPSKNRLLLFIIFLIFALNLISAKSGIKVRDFVSFNFSPQQVLAQDEEEESGEEDGNYEEAESCGWEQKDNECHDGNEVEVWYNSCDGEWWSSDPVGSCGDTGGDDQGGQGDCWERKDYNECHDGQEVEVWYNYCEDRWDMPPTGNSCGDNGQSDPEPECNYQDDSYCAEDNKTCSYRRDLNGVCPDVEGSCDLIENSCGFTPAPSCSIQQVEGRCEKDLTGDSNSTRWCDTVHQEVCGLDHEPNGGAWANDNSCYEDERCGYAPDDACEVVDSWVEDENNPGSACKAQVDCNGNEVSRDCSKPEEVPGLFGAPECSFTGEIRDVIRGEENELICKAQVQWCGDEENEIVEEGSCHEVEVEEEDQLFLRGLPDCTGFSCDAGTHCEIDSETNAPACIADSELVRPEISSEEECQQLEPDKPVCEPDGVERRYGYAWNNNQCSKALISEKPCSQDQAENDISCQQQAGEPAFACKAGACIQSVSIWDGNQCTSAEREADDPNACGVDCSIAPDGTLIVTDGKLKEECARQGKAVVNGICEDINFNCAALEDPDQKNECLENEAKAKAEVAVTKQFIPGDKCNYPESGACPAGQTKACIGVRNNSGDCEYSPAIDPACSQCQEGEVDVYNTKAYCSEDLKCINGPGANCTSDLSCQLNAKPNEGAAKPAENASFEVGTKCEPYTEANSCPEGQIKACPREINAEGVCAYAGGECTPCGEPGTINVNNDQAYCEAGQCVGGPGKVCLTNNECPQPESACSFPQTCDTGGGEGVQWCQGKYSADAKVCESVAGKSCTVCTTEPQPDPSNNRVAFCSKGVCLGGPGEACYDDKDCPQPVVAPVYTSTPVALKQGQTAGNDGQIYQYVQRCENKLRPIQVYRQYQDDAAKEGEEIFAQQQAENVTISYFEYQDCVLDSVPTGLKSRVLEVANQQDIVAYNRQVAFNTSLQQTINEGVRVNLTNGDPSKLNEARDQLRDLISGMPDGLEKEQFQRLLNSINSKIEAQTNITRNNAQIPFNTRETLFYQRYEEAKNLLATGQPEDADKAEAILNQLRALTQEETAKEQHRTYNDFINNIHTRAEELRDQKRTQSQVDEFNKNYKRLGELLKPDGSVDEVNAAEASKIQQDLSLMCGYVNNEQVRQDICSRIGNVISRTACSDSISYSEDGKRLRTNRCSGEVTVEDNTPASASVPAVLPSTGAVPDESQPPTGPAYGPFLTSSCDPNGKAISYTYNSQTGKMERSVDLKCAAPVGETDPQARLAAQSKLVDEAIASIQEQEKAENKQNLTAGVQSGAGATLEYLACSNVPGYRYFHWDRCSQLYDAVGETSSALGTGLIASTTSSQRFEGDQAHNQVCEQQLQLLAGSETAIYAVSSLESLGCKLDTRTPEQRAASIRSTQSETKNINAALASAGFENSGLRAEKIKGIAAGIEGFDINNPEADAGLKEIFIRQVAESDPTAAKFVLEFIGVPLTSINNEKIAKEVCYQQNSRASCDLGVYGTEARVDPRNKARDLSTFSQADADDLNERASQIFDTDGFQPADLNKVQAYARYLQVGQTISRAAAQAPAGVRIPGEEVYAQQAGIDISTPEGAAEWANVKRTYDLWNKTADQIINESSTGKVYGQAREQTGTDLVIGVAGAGFDAPDYTHLISGAVKVLITRRALARLSKAEADQIVEAAARGEAKILEDEAAVAAEKARLETAARPAAGPVAAANDAPNPPRETVVPPAGRVVGDPGINPSVIDPDVPIVPRVDPLEAPVAPIAAVPTAAAPASVPVVVPDAAPIVIPELPRTPVTPRAAGDADARELVDEARRQLEGATTPAERERARADLEAAEALLDEQRRGAAGPAVIVDEPVRVDPVEVRVDASTRVEGTDDPLIGPRLADPLEDDPPAVAASVVLDEPEVPAVKVDEPAPGPVRAAEPDEPVVARVAEPDPLADEIRRSNNRIRAAEALQDLAPLSEVDIEDIRYSLVTGGFEGEVDELDELVGQVQSELEAMGRTVRGGTPAPPGADEAIRVAPEGPQARREVETPAGTANVEQILRGDSEISGWSIRGTGNRDDLVVIRFRDGREDIEMRVGELLDEGKIPDAKRPEPKAVSAPEEAAPAEQPAPGRQEPSRPVRTQAEAEAEALAQLSDYTRRFDLNTLSQEDIPEDIIRGALIEEGFVGTDDEIAAAARRISERVNTRREVVPVPIEGSERPRVSEEIRVEEAQRRYDLAAQRQQRLEAVEANLTQVRDELQVLPEGDEARRVELESEVNRLTAESLSIQAEQDLINTQRYNLYSAQLQSARRRLDKLADDDSLNRAPILEEIDYLEEARRDLGVNPLSEVDEAQRALQTARLDLAISQDPEVIKAREAADNIFPVWTQASNETDRLANEALEIAIRLPEGAGWAGSVENSAEVSRFLDEVVAATKERRTINPVQIIDRFRLEAAVDRFQDTLERKNQLTRELDAATAHRFELERQKGLEITNGPNPPEPPSGPRPPTPIRPRVDVDGPQPISLQRQVELEEGAVGLFRYDTANLDETGLRPETSEAMVKWHFENGLGFDGTPEQLDESVRRVTVQVNANRELPPDLRDARLRFNEADTAWRDVRGTVEENEANIRRLEAMLELRRVSDHYHEVPEDDWLAELGRASIRDDIERLRNQTSAGEAIRDMAEVIDDVPIVSVALDALDEAAAVVDEVASTVAPTPQVSVITPGSVAENNLETLNNLAQILTPQSFAGNRRVLATNMFLTDDGRLVRLGEQGANTGALVRVRWRLEDEVVKLDSVAIPASRPIRDLAPLNLAIENFDEGRKVSYGVDLSRQVTNFYIQERVLEEALRVSPEQRTVAAIRDRLRYYGMGDEEAQAIASRMKQELDPVVVQPARPVAVEPPAPQASPVGRLVEYAPGQDVPIEQVTKGEGYEYWYQVREGGGTGATTMLNDRLGVVAKFAHYPDDIFNIQAELAVVENNSGLFPRVLNRIVNRDGKVVGYVMEQIQGEKLAAFKVANLPKESKIALLYRLADFYDEMGVPRYDVDANFGDHFWVDQSPSGKVRVRSIDPLARRISNDGFLDELIALTKGEKLTDAQIAGLRVPVSIEVRGIVDKLEFADDPAIRLIKQRLDENREMASQAYAYRRGQGQKPPIKSLNEILAEVEQTTPQGTEFRNAKNYGWEERGGGTINPCRIAAITTEKVYLAQSNISNVLGISKGPQVLQASIGPGDGCPLRDLVEDNTALKAVDNAVGGALGKAAGAADESLRPLAAAADELIGGASLERPRVQLEPYKHDANIFSAQAGEIRRGESGAGDYLYFIDREGRLSPYQSAPDDLPVVITYQQGREGVIVSDVRIPRSSADQQETIRQALRGAFGNNEQAAIRIEPDNEVMASFTPPKAVQEGIPGRLADIAQEEVPVVGPIIARVLDRDQILPVKAGDPLQGTATLRSEAARSLVEFVDNPGLRLVIAGESYTVAPKYFKDDLGRVFIPLRSDDGQVYFIYHSRSDGTFERFAGLARSPRSTEPIYTKSTMGKRANSLSISEDLAIKDLVEAGVITDSGRVVDRGFLREDLGFTPLSPMITYDPEKNPLDQILRRTGQENREISTQDASRVVSSLVDQEPQRVIFNQVNNTIEAYTRGTVNGQEYDLKLVFYTNQSPKADPSGRVTIVERRSTGNEAVGAVPVKYDFVLRPVDNPQAAFVPDYMYGQGAEGSGVPSVVRTRYRIGNYGSSEGLVAAKEWQALADQIAAKYEPIVGSRLDNFSGSKAQADEIIGSIKPGTSDIGGCDLVGYNSTLINLAQVNAYVLGISKGPAVLAANSDCGDIEKAVQGLVKEAQDIPVVGDEIAGVVSDAAATLDDLAETVSDRFNLGSAVPFDLSTLPYKFDPNNLELRGSERLANMGATAKIILTDSDIERLSAVTTIDEYSRVFSEITASKDTFIVERDPQTYEITKYLESQGLPIERLSKPKDGSNLELGEDEYISPRLGRDFDKVLVSADENQRQLLMNGIADDYGRMQAAGVSYGGNHLGNFIVDADNTVHLIDLKNAQRVRVDWNNLDSIYTNYSPEIAGLAGQLQIAGVSDAEIASVIRRIVDNYPISETDKESFISKLGFNGHSASAPCTLSLRDDVVNLAQVNSYVLGISKGPQVLQASTGPCPYNVSLGAAILDDPTPLESKKIRVGELIGQGGNSNAYSVSGNENLVLIELGVQRGGLSSEGIEREVAARNNLITALNKLSNDVNVPRVHKVWVEDGKVYQLMERAYGSPVHARDADLLGWQNQLDILANAPQEHYDKLIRDIKEVEKLGLQVDPSKPDNFFYDPKIGFTLIDLSLQASGSTYSVLNEIQIPLVYTYNIYTRYSDQLSPEISQSIEKILEKTRVAKGEDAQPESARDVLNFLERKRENGFKPESSAISEGDELPNCDLSGWKFNLGLKDDVVNLAQVNSYVLGISKGPQVLAATICNLTDDQRESLKTNYLTDSTTSTEVIETPGKEPILRVIYTNGETVDYPAADVLAHPLLVLNTPEPIALKMFPFRFTEKELGAYEAEVTAKTLDAEAKRQVLLEVKQAADAEQANFNAIKQFEIGAKDRIAELEEGPEQGPLVTAEIGRQKALEQKAAGELQKAQRVLEQKKQQLALATNDYREALSAKTSAQQDLEEGRVAVEKWNNSSFPVKATEVVSIGYRNGQQVVRQVQIQTAGLAEKVAIPVNTKLEPLRNYLGEMAGVRVEGYQIAPGREPIKPFEQYSQKTQEAAVRVKNAIEAADGISLKGGALEDQVIAYWVDKGVNSAEIISRLKQAERAIEYADVHGGVSVYASEIFTPAVLNYPPEVQEAMQALKYDSRFAPRLYSENQNGTTPLFKLSTTLEGQGQLRSIIADAILAQEYNQKQVKPVLERSVQALEALKGFAIEKGGFDESSFNQWDQIGDPTNIHVVPIRLYNSRPNDIGQFDFPDQSILLDEKEGVTVATCLHEKCHFEFYTKNLADVTGDVTPEDRDAQLELVLGTDNGRKFAEGLTEWTTIKGVQLTGSPLESDQIRLFHGYPLQVKAINNIRDLIADRLVNKRPDIPSIEDRREIADAILVGTQLTGDYEKVFLAAGLHADQNELTTGVEAIKDILDKTPKAYPDVIKTNKAGWGFRLLQFGTLPAAGSLLYGGYSLLRPQLETLPQAILNLISDNSRFNNPTTFQTIYS